VNSTSDGCAGTQFTVEVTVNPAPTINDKELRICSGTTFSFTPANVTDGIVPAGTKYTWTVSPASNPSVVSGQSDQTAQQTAISQTLDNHTAIVQTVTYTVSPVSADGCTGSNFTLTVKVNPKPAIAAKSATICSGTYTMSPAGGDIVPTNTTYTWTISTNNSNLTGQTALSNQSSFTQTLNNGTGSAQTITYSVIPTATIDGTACAGTAFNVSITVNPGAGMTLTSGTTIPAICSGSTVSYTATSGTLGATFSWVRAAVTGITPATASGSNATISEALTNSTNQQITVTYVFTLTSGACTNDIPVTVVVNPKLSLTETAINRIICSGETFDGTPADGSGNIVPAGTLYSWTVIPASSPTVVSGQSAASNQTAISQTLFNHTGTAQTVTYHVTTSSYGCPGHSFTVTVVVREHISNYPDIRLQLCTGLTSQIHLSSYLDTLNFVSVAWSRISTGSPDFTGSTATTTGTLNTADFSLGTHIYEYAMTNICNTSATGRVYIKKTANPVVPAMVDTIVICQSTPSAAHLQLNQMLGLETNGIWSYDALLNQYVTAKTSPSQFAGAYIFDAASAWAATSSSLSAYKITYNSDTNAAAFRFKYTTGSQNCFGNRERHLVLVITSSILPLH
jgi:hypothetical protein